MAPASATKILGLLALLLASSGSARAMTITDSTTGGAPDAGYTTTSTTDTGVDCGGGAPSPAVVTADGTPAPTVSYRCMPSLSSDTSTTPGTTPTPTAAETPEPTIRSDGAGTTADDSTGAGMTATEAGATVAPSPAASSSSAGGRGVDSTMAPVDSTMAPEAGTPSPADGAAAATTTTAPDVEDAGTPSPASASAAATQGPTNEDGLTAEEADATDGASVLSPPLLSFSSSSAAIAAVFGLLLAGFAA